MDAMIISTNDTSSLNALITLALKQTIQAAVQAAIEDRLADLDAATAGVAAKVIALERFTSGLDRALVTSIGEYENLKAKVQNRILALEKRCDEQADRIKASGYEHSRIHKVELDIETRIRTLEEEVDHLQHANIARDKEREDIIADLIDTRLEYALEDLDLTEQVRNVLSDATITI